MYRDLFQVKAATDEPIIAAGTVKTYGVFTLFNTRAFLIQMKASQVGVDTKLEVFINAFFSANGGTSARPDRPDLNDDSLWTLIHTNTAMETQEPLIYERCQTSAEWLRFRVTAGTGATLNDLDIVLSKQAWR